MCVGQPGRVLWTHRCSTVELVVGADAELRVDGGVGLQDSGAHVQNGRGAMVQTVLQNKAPVSAPKGDRCLERPGSKPGSGFTAELPWTFQSRQKEERVGGSPAMVILCPRCCCQHLPVFHPLLTSTFQFSLFLWKPRR